MSEVVDRSDGYEGGEEQRGDLLRLRAGYVQVQGQETDGEVEELAGNFVAVDLRMQRCELARRAQGVNGVRV